MYLQCNQALAREQTLRLINNIIGKCTQHVCIFLTIAAVTLHHSQECSWQGIAASSSESYNFSTSLTMEFLNRSCKKVPKDFGPPKQTFVTQHERTVVYFQECPSCKLSSCPPLVHHLQNSQIQETGLCTYISKIMYNLETQASRAVLMSSNFHFKST